MRWASSLIVAAAVAACAPVSLAQNSEQAPAKSGGQSPAKAPAVTLKVGDKAPAMSIEKWVKGEPVTGFEKGKVYVLDFWATWCGPCIRSMPHLTELQKEYKDKGVTIIGVTREDPRNSLAQVEQMVKDKADVMGYHVAWDKNGETSRAYMRAAGKNSIPTAFVVDGSGTLVHIGHPNTLDMVLEGVIRGDWDAKTGPEKLKAMDAALAKVMGTRDPKKALAAFDEMAKTYPAVAAKQQDLYYSLLTRTSDPRAGEIGRTLAKKAIDEKNPMALNEIAWTIVDPALNVEKKDLDLAAMAASKAVEITGENDAAILDTLARVHFCKGEVDKAIQWQKKAIAKAPAEMRGELEGTLKEYESAKK